MWTHGKDGTMWEFLKSATRSVRQKGGRSGGEIERKLSEVNARAMSRGQNKLIDKFKMAAGDVISITG